MGENIRNRPTLDQHRPGRARLPTSIDTNCQVYCELNVCKRRRLYGRIRPQVHRSALADQTKNDANRSELADLKWSLRHRGLPVGVEY